MQTGLYHLSVDWPADQSACLPTYLPTFIIYLFSLKLEMGMMNVIQSQNYQLWPTLFDCPL